MNKKPYVLVLGSNENAKEFVRRNSGNGTAPYKFLGCFTLNGSHGRESTGSLPILGRSSSLRGYIFRSPVDIILVSTSLSPDLSRELLEPALEIGLTVAVPKGVAVSLEPVFAEKIFTRRAPFLGVDTALLTTVPPRRLYLLLKRVIDCLGSAIGLVLLSPILLLVALAIKLNSPKASVFYRLDWVGRNGKPFTGYKFRTMIPGADKLKEELRPFNEMSGPVFKMRNDPRVTRLGRFLRKFSIDELPQLYNVLKGDLSLVGPRAPLREEAEKFAFWQRRKLSVRPGITCLWQVNGRGEICDFEKWAQLDLEYIENASILLDLKILLQTIPAVLSGRGAS
jgi:exopolysaccharide biosynthesis polyprenyl glycosylphosphotransferase